MTDQFLVLRIPVLVPTTRTCQVGDYNFEIKCRITYIFYDAYLSGLVRSGTIFLK